MYHNKLAHYKEELTKKTLSQEEYRKLVEVFIDFACIIEEKSPELVEKLMFKIHEMAHGPHFNREIAEYKVSEMENEDGSKGAHWTYEQTTELAEDKGTSFNRFNEADFYYMMNMWWSDHYKSTKGDIDLIYDQVMEKLNDKDGILGFAWYYAKMKAKYKKD